MLIVIVPLGDDGDPGDEQPQTPVLRTRTEPDRFQITLNPPPFPGDDQKTLICVECGYCYTMAEYRVYSWEAHSDICWLCKDRHNRELIRRIVAEQNGESTSK